MTPPAGGRFQSLQAGRAVAALLVVLVHCSISIFALPKYWGTKPFGAVFDFGGAGVEFFFVLSGFIIAHVHWQDMGTPAKLGAFLFKRFRRIYPLYWIILALVSVAFFMNPAFSKGHERDPLVILSSFLLLHFTWGEPVLPVSWTLFHEVFFYAVYGLMIYRLRLGLAAAVLFACGSVIRVAIGKMPPPLEFLFSPYNLLFVMGALVASWCRSRRVPVPGLLVLFGVAVFAGTAVEEVHRALWGQPVRTLLYGTGSALALAGVVELERSNRLRVWAWLRLTGDASYAIYLAHFPMQSLAAKTFLAAGLCESLDARFSFVLLVLISILFGIALHLALERPLLHLLSHRRQEAAPE